MHEELKSYSDFALLCETVPFGRIFRRPPKAEKPFGRTAFLFILGNTKVSTNSISAHQILTYSIYYAIIFYSIITWRSLNGLHYSVPPFRCCRLPHLSRFRDDRGSRSRCSSCEPFLGAQHPWYRSVHSASVGPFHQLALPPSLKGVPMSNFSGLLTRAGSPGDLSLAHQPTFDTSGFVQFLNSRRITCPGGCGIIHEINLQAHEHFGCECATEIGRGPIQS